MVHKILCLIVCHYLIVVVSILSLHRDSRSPSLYRVKNYDKNKQWLKGKPKPLTEESSSTEVARPVSPGHKKRLSKSSVLEGSQVHELLQGAVSGVVGNFVGITRAVRQRILPDKQLLEVGHHIYCFLAWFCLSVYTCVIRT